MGRTWVHPLFLPLLFLSPLIANAADLDPEKDVERRLEQSRVVIEKVIDNFKVGASTLPEISSLKTLSADIKVSHLFLQERFRLREEELKARGAKALARHRVMAEGYREALEEYLSQVDSLPPGEIFSLTAIDRLQFLLTRILPKKKRPIFGTLPYRNLNYPTREPRPDPAIKPAYKGGNKTVTPDDLKSTVEAPLSKEVADLAQSLLWNPVSIYEWVKNNVETEWYWGCMKGEAETLRQRSGNDCDQAALLVALLRASGYPARYVRGVIEFFPDIERAKNLTGIEDPAKIAEFFQKAGVPFTPVIAGGRMANFQLEHVWVETQVPYANYRGAILDEHGKTWLGLDTSIKVKDYLYNNPADLSKDFSLANIRDEYLGAIQSQTPLEYLRTKVEAYLSQTSPSASYNGLLRSRTLPPEVMNILPASMQYRQVKVTNEYTQIPDELFHKVRFIATRNPQLATGGADNELFTLTLNTLQLSNQRIAVVYEPETVEDQDIINSYGGLDNTPAYLVRLRPVLTVNGERMVVGKDGLPMGDDYTLILELISPNGVEKITGTHIAGNLAAIGIVSQKAISSQLSAIGEEDDAETILYKEANRYIDRWNQAEEELAALMKLTLTRPAPTVVTLGGVIDVTYLLDTPHGFEWKGVFVDADVRAIEAVGAYGNTSVQAGGQAERQKTFMQLSALQGSILENRIFEDDFQVEAISTAKLFGLAHNTEPEIQLLTIDKTNIDAILPTLPFDENIKQDVRNAVNQNMIVRIPQSEITYEDWTGIGYIKENRDTGEAGYMLSGMIAGGESVETPEEWALQYIARKLGKPFTGKPNEDQTAAAKLIKIHVTDRQPGLVGKAIDNPLAVLVQDIKGIPVSGASVTFKIVAGGGNLNGAQEYEAITGRDGIAKAPLTLGLKTGANPSYLLGFAEEFATQIGLNIVTAWVKGKSGNISINQPFEAYGKPGKPAKIIKILGDGRKALVNTPAGGLHARVEDENENPISNLILTFTALPAESYSQFPDTPPSPLPSGYRNIQFYRLQDCNNPYPLYGNCPTAEEIKVKTTHLGAIVGTILGNTVSTKYNVAVSRENLSPISFTLYSTGYRKGTDCMPPYFGIGGMEIVNDQGKPVNAARAGSELKAPLRAELFLLYDDYTMEFTGTCWNIKASGIVHVKPITDGTVTFTPAVGGGTITSVRNLQNGKYEARYTTGSSVGVNTIQAEGEAMLEVPEILGGLFGPTSTCYDTNILQTRVVTLKSGQDVYFDESTKEPIINLPVVSKEWIVYGVDAQLTMEPQVFMLDDEGYAGNDSTFKYRILPSEYGASNAFIDIYAIDENMNDTLVTYLIGNKVQGEGASILSAGPVFDPNKKYEAEVVLNRGTDMEIKSERLNVPVAGIQVIDGNEKVVEESKFGDGSRLEKRYQIKLLSKNLMEACEGLKGQARVVDKKGVKIEVLGNKDNQDYYLSEYDLAFSLSDGQCAVSIKDATAGGMAKRNIILSNLSKSALGARLVNQPSVDLTKIAVLYAGLGNSLEIEINGMKKGVEIEPVGVILIGIDGLRQDVLYPEGKDNVKEGGKYRVDIGQLGGMNQILLGYNQPEAKQSYIMLPEVTAIFPSITYASWASIFTGELPNETGITGNEFFDRDLSGSGSNSIPGMAGIPAGMVSLQDGAFSSGGKKFVLGHAIPAEFSLFGYLRGSESLSEKIANSAPLAVLQVPTLFEDIGEAVTDKYSIASNGDIRCDKSQYECRTVAMFSQYAEGADWWGTPSLSLKNAFDSVKSFFDVPTIMDAAPKNEAIAFINNYFSKETLE